MMIKIEIDEVVKAKIYKATFFDENECIINTFDFTASSMDDACAAIQESAKKIKQ